MPALNGTRRHPAITLAASGLILVSTLVLSSMIPTNFLGSSGNASLQVAKTPEEGDVKLVETAAPVEKALGSVDGVRDVITSIPLSIAGTPSTISYDLQFGDGADAQSVSAAVEKKFDTLKNAGTIQLATQDAFVGDAGGSGIALQIRGNDPSALLEASDLLERQLT